VGAERKRSDAGGGAMKGCGAALVLFVMATWPARGALAYSELSRFSDATDLGGGAGVWFTGSPADGYDCSVCHESTEPLAVTITGLPERYDLGATYEVLMTWPMELEHVSALVEFSDEHGRGAGSVVLPGDAAMAQTESDTCMPYGLGIPAMQRFSAPDFNISNDRQIAGLVDCGGRQLRLQWTAPAQDAGPIFFSGGVVESNHMSDLHGDAVVDLSQPILPRTQPAYALNTRGGCSVAAVSTHRSRGWFGTWLMLAASYAFNMWQRRRA
jgi:hypothetical protein